MGGHLITLYYIFQTLSESWMFLYYIILGTNKVQIIRHLVYENYETLTLAVQKFTLFMYSSRSIAMPEPPSSLPKAFRIWVILIMMKMIKKKIV